MNKTEKKLLNVFSDLDDNDQNSLMAFAQFLLQKAEQEGRSGVEEQLSLVNIPRPEEEKVIAAIKRLSATYPMLKKDKLMNETAALMSEHMLQGRSAVEVIDKLEKLFQNHYDKFNLKNP
ncbi:MAG: Crp/Fnr family transcriptional regulator [gamma proteobacterium symbiont of Taylorina sp.]|nr:Crp/Fnr family transcriptional regulator [gamma proteobacterium symbiont of Taylorina sp.]